MGEITRRTAIGGAGSALASRAWGAGTGDVATLRRAYTLMHPGLLRYASAPQVSARFDRLERDFGEAPDLAARYLVLSRFLATVRCGHTYANFYNQKKATQAALFSARDRLPFQFLWLGSRMIVTADPTGAGIARGTEVLTIEGRPARDVLAGLMTVARADGSNDGKRRRLMSVQAEDGFETFDVFYPLLFGGHDHYRLDLRAPDGHRRTQTVEAIGLDARRAQRKAPVEGDAAIWTYEKRGTTVVVTMPSWALYDSKWDWRSWTSARFEEMARTGVTGLILDVRGNEGGEDCGDAFVAHLIETPLQVRNARRLVRYRRAPEDLVPALDTWDKSFLDWGEAAQPYDARFYELHDKENDGRAVGEVRPARPRFRGKVAVLVDAQNSSATHQFADSMRRNRLGVLVGEETGGNQRGINGGAFFFLRLKESGLEADLPVIGAFPREPRPDRGVPPDILVTPTAASLAAGGDPAMEKALEAVRG